ncbi:Asp-tRNA(Asn)/Glu-tRNA(Gln) amidotransferase subunit GatC, partial [Candidatus Woesearchaeota archaeon]|nr:Asp-tRNA(Asn)/Glu-tRNA(Gln) amidotransferase subunit GatC [Candidatus Woesearchaeota archaeon]
EEVTKEIGRASQLQLTESEVIKFTKDLQEILSAFSILDEADLVGVAPSFQPIQHRNVLRDDTIIPSLSQEQTLSFTKQHENGFFIGPKTIE